MRFSKKSLMNKNLNERMTYIYGGMSVVILNTLRNFFFEKVAKLFGGLNYFTYICNVNNKNKIKL